MDKYKYFLKKHTIFIIFIFGLLLRFIGFNWDDNNHLHPDERFLTMVVSDIKLPTSLSEYFNTNISPLNPYNYPQYQFFVYGTFPLFLTKILAVILGLDNYNHITLLGRILSALFDSGNIVLIYFIAKKIVKPQYVYLPSLFYAFLILPLQLSHFFAVDTFLSFFITLTFTLLSFGYFVPAFFIYGLALSCKVSALFFAPVIFLLIIYKKKKFSLVLKSSFLFLISLISFRIFQPYSFVGIFTPNSNFINNLTTLTSYSSAGIYYPPGVQWLNRLPLVNSLFNIALWGLGFSFSISFLFLIIIFYKKSKLKFNQIFIICFWVLLLYLYQGSQFSHSMRYFLPIYPFICIIFVSLLSHLKVKKYFIILVLFFNLIHAFAFLSIYSRPNSRVQASNWINQNIPKDSVLSSEYWDDALPLGYSEYQNISLALFDPDTDEKWQKINDSLNQIDYLIMSSNRLWATIPRLPKEYPTATLFYKNLFAQNLNFVKVKEFNSYPGFPLSFLKSCYYFGPSNYPGIINKWFETDVDCLYPGIYLRDDTAEEAFTVYDHPKVLIYEKKLN